MNIFRIVFGVLCIVLVSKSEEYYHHIYQRVLENEDSSETTLEPPNVVISNLKSTLSQNTSVNCTPRCPSEILEEELVTLPSHSSSLPTNSAAVENNTILTYGNDSSLLRKPLASDKPVVDVDNPLYIGVVPNGSANGIQAPEIFPNGTSVNGAKIIEGDSEKLQTLTSQLNSTTEKTKNLTNVDTEVNDLLHNPVNEEVAAHQHPLEPQEPAQIQDTFNDDTELIENGDDTEEKLRHPKISNLDDDPPALQQRYLAAILVCSLVAASVVCYAALLVWRRYLENRYGSRTMLVNEEEFDDPNDLRHFSI